MTVFWPNHSSELISLISVFRSRPMGECASRFPLSRVRLLVLVSSCDPIGAYRPTGHSDLDKGKREAGLSIGRLRNTGVNSHPLR